MESDGLLAHADQSSATPVPAKRGWSWVLSPILSVIFVTSMLAFMTSGKKSTAPESHDGTASEIFASSSFSSSSSKIYLTATNEYGSFDGKSYPWMSDVTGTQLVEPYKNTTLTLSGSYVKSKYTYSWAITNEDTDDDNYDDDSSPFIGSISSNASFQTIVFTETGIYKIIIAAVDSTGAVVHTYQTRLICK